MYLVVMKTDKVYRIRYQVMSSSFLDFKSEGNKLAEMIKQYDMNA